MESSLFKILVAVVLVGFAFYVGNNIIEGVENRNNTYLQYLNK